MGACRTEARLETSPSGSLAHRHLIRGMMTRQNRMLIASLVCFLLAVLVLTVGCDTPTGPDSGDPREAHVLSETDRFAGMLGVRVKAVVTDEVYSVLASNPKYPGEKVPAAGWYNNGLIKYWRPVILERSMDYGTALAAHETCHALFKQEDGADSCASRLLAN